MVPAGRLILALVASLSFSGEGVRSSESLDEGEELQPSLSCESAEQTVADLGKKFRAGHLLVHMKRDFGNPRADLERWALSEHLDYGLSYSLVHPQMALEALWVKTGYLIDASKCQALAGSKADLWVNNMVSDGAHEILSTPGGRRAELMRLLWLRFKSAGGKPMHVVLPSGFKEWAARPESWTSWEKEVFKAKTTVVLHPFEEIPDAGEVTTMLKALEEGTLPVTVADGLSALSTMVAQDYDTFSKTDPPRTTFSEVLALCPLSALAGFVYSLQHLEEMDQQALESVAEAFREQGRSVISTIREAIPSLSSQPLVLAEYKPTSEDSMDIKIADPPVADMPGILDKQGKVTFKFKEEFEAKLSFPAVDC